jgi:hypothetical protein
MIVLGRINFKSEPIALQSFCEAEEHSGESG